MTTTTTPAHQAPAPRSDRQPDPAPWRRALLPIFVVSLVAGLVGMWMRITDGHLPAGYGSYVPWGLWIAIYFHGVGVAAGAFAMSAVGYLAAIPGFRSGRSLRVAAVIVAATVGPALLAVGLDLGHMTRAYRILTDPSFTSMMAFNSWMYMALLAVTAVVYVLSLRPDRGWLKPFLILGLVLSVMIPSQSGAFFGVVDAKPFWHSALLPVMMLVSGMTAGAAALLVVRALLSGPGLGEVREGRRDTSAVLSGLRKVVVVGLVAYFVIEFAEFSFALWSPAEAAPEISLILTGTYWWVFWLVHVTLGGIVPLVLFLTRNPAAWVVGAALVAFTFIATRLNVLIPGQSVGQLEGLQEAYYHPRLSYEYSATLMEYLVALFILALAMAVLYVGLRVTAALESRESRKDEHHVAS